ncbi:putative DBH-like monooxygenase protein 2 [Lissotriton helveticus]
MGCCRFNSLNMSRQVLYFLSLLSLAGGQMEDLRFSKAMNPEGTVVVRWDINKATEEITIEMEARTLGWIGFGLSPSGGMIGADIAIGGVMPNQTTYFGDYHAIGHFKPILDPMQNFRLLSVTENETSTIMRYIRKFRTCDPDDVDVTANTQRIIAAFGETDTLEYHGPNQHFQASVQLLSETPVSQPDPVPSFSYDLKMTNFPVPSTDTTYGCAYLPLPQVQVKHHVYKFDPIIQRDNGNLVHHMIIYGCPNATNVSVPPGICMNNTEFFPCRQIIFAWAVGGGSFTLPTNAGISLGTNLDPQFIRLEIHYNNPQMLSGQKDNSGIRIHYTTVLRIHNAGVLTTGILVEKLAFIPPKAYAFKQTSVCKTDKFNQVVGEPIPDMQVFAVLLHTHLTGTAVQVNQYRDGKQIGFLGRDMAYDFSLQETRYLPNITTIKIGDVLQVECTYNTTKRTDVTYGGYSTTSEMCFGFLIYYPANLIAECASNPDYGSLSSPFGFNIYSNPAALNTVSWTPENISLVQKVTTESTQNIAILHFNGSILEDTGSISNITPPEVPPCNSSETSSTAPTMSSMSLMTNMPNTEAHCPNGQYPSSGHLCLSLFLLSTFSAIVSSFLDF